MGIYQSKVIPETVLETDITKTNSNENNNTVTANLNIKSENFNENDTDENNEQLSSITINTEWKNKPESNNEKYFWIYRSIFSYSYFFMPKILSDKFETDYQIFIKNNNNDDNFHISHNDLNLKINFVNMTQTNEQNGTTRQIRRLSYDEFVRLKEDYFNYMINRDELWACEFVDKYILYTPTIQENLEEHNKHGTILIQDRLSYPYSIDPIKMEQINSLNGRVRKIIKITKNQTTNKPLIGSFGYQCL